ncbi:MAG: hypothetical protein ABI855_01830 [Bacteroidota bacterium]
MKKKILIVLFLLASGFETMFAQQPAVILSDKKGWHKIGETTVDFKKDRDEILVMGADRFAAIKFEVTDAAIDLQDLEIYYENGPNQNVEVRAPLIVGHESKVIDLIGGERALKKIVFVYKTLPNRKDEKAHVLVWGLKTNADAGMVHPSTNKDMQADRIDARTNEKRSDGEMAKPAVVISDKPGWHKIGETHVDFKNERDELKVLGKDQFKQIKLRAEDAGIEFNDVEVYYENDNTPQKIHVAMILKAGEETRSIDLEGRNKSIDKIVLIYKTVPNQQKERGEVAVYGLK